MGYRRCWMADLWFGVFASTTCQALDGGHFSRELVRSDCRCLEMKGEVEEDEGEGDDEAAGLKHLTRSQLPSVVKITTCTCSQ